MAVGDGWNSRCCMKSDRYTCFLVAMLSCIKNKLIQGRWDIHVGTALNLTVTEDSDISLRLNNCFGQGLNKLLLLNISVIWSPPQFWMTCTSCTKKR